VSETIGGQEFFNPASLWGITADVTVPAGGFTMLAAGYFRQVELASEVVGRSPTITHLHVPSVLVADVH
ncbi:MAG: hypothetical protein ACO3RE_07040, partial [Ilumatobacteraceae bacterium]